MDATVSMPRPGVRRVGRTALSAGHPVGCPLVTAQGLNKSPAQSLCQIDESRIPVRCRLCDSNRLQSVLDLGATPPCETFLTTEQLDSPETTFPLHLRLC